MLGRGGCWQGRGICAVYVAVLDRVVGNRRLMTEHDDAIAANGVAGNDRARDARGRSKRRHAWLGRDRSGWSLLEDRPFPFRGRQRIAGDLRTPRGINSVVQILRSSSEFIAGMQWHETCGASVVNPNRGDRAIVNRPTAPVAMAKS